MGASTSGGAMADGISEEQRIAADLGEPMAAVALAWVRQQPGIMSLLVGARNPDEVQRNLPSIELILPDDILQELARVTEPLKEALGENLDMWFVPARMR